MRHDLRVTRTTQAVRQHGPGAQAIDGRWATRGGGLLLGALVGAFLAGGIGTVAELVPGRGFTSALGIASLVVTLVSGGVAPELVRAIFKHGSPRDATKFVGIGALVPLTVVSAVYLAHQGPAVTVVLPAGCPRSPLVSLARQTSIGTKSDQDCFGMIGLAAGDQDLAFGRDSPTPGIRSATRSISLTDLERQILAANPPPGAAALTVIWVGELTCRSYTAAQECAADTPADVAEHAHLTEFAELQGLFLAQQDRSRTSRPVRVVIADAGEIDRYLLAPNGDCTTPDAGSFTDLCTMIEQQDRKGAFGPDRVVVGLGNSTSASVATIQYLTREQIPVVAPTLVAEYLQPGKPLVQQPGYLQLSAPIDVAARHVIDTVRASYGSSTPGVTLDIYRANRNTDFYTRSLTDDLKADAALPPPGTGADLPQRIPVHPQPVEPGGLKPDICRKGPGPNAQPTVVMFADRYYRFPDFVKEVSGLCPDPNHPPELVIADGSANRIMGDDSSRTNLVGDWPLLYYAGGLQCAELAALTSAQGLLDTINHQFGQVCASGRDQVGDHLAPFWDAVQLIEDLADDAAAHHLRLTPTDLQSLTHVAKPYRLAEGTVTVQDGQIQPERPAVPVIPLCVTDIRDVSASRSANACSLTHATLTTDPRLPTFHPDR